MTDTYPKAMVHPSARKSVIQRPIDPKTGQPDLSTAFGTPDRFPPVTVSNPSQESYYRAQGYHATGEPAAVTQHYDFPMYLQHKTAEPVLVNSLEEMDAREADGYFAVGTSNPDAFEKSSAVPYVPGQVVEEFPKMVNGVVIDPTRTDGFQRYPMWLNGALVNNEAEELAARGTEKEEPVVPRRVTQIEDEKPKRKSMSDEQKAAMKAGRARAKAAKELAAA